MVLYNQADLHLDTFPWARRPEFKGDAFAAMESSQEVILADPIAPNNEKVVILAGDITEKALIDDATNACIARVLSLYKEKGVQVLYINGNHDKSKHAYRDSCGHVGIHGGIHIGNGEEVVIGSLRIRGLDWMPRSELREKIQDIPECDILVIHCAFQHLLGFAGSFDLVADDVPATVKHSVLVGDVHVTNVTKNINGTQIVSPGPLHPCSISQKGPHGTMRLVEGQDHWEFLEHTSRQVLDYTLDEDTRPGRMSDKIKKDAAELELIPHCVIRYKSDNGDVAEAIMEKIAGCVHIHEKKTSCGHIMDAHQRQQIIKDIRETSMLEEIKNLPTSAASSLVERLLETDDPGSVLDTEIKEILNANS